MALIKCPDCGTDVSNAAPACPKCGRPIAIAAQPRKSANAGCAVVIVLALVFFIFVLANGGSESSPSSAPSPQPAPAESTASDTPAAPSTAPTPAECANDLRCIGEKLVANSELVVECKDSVDTQAANDSQWDDGFLSPIISKYRWTDKPGGDVDLLGDRVKFQNGIGNFMRMTYACTVDPATNHVIAAQVMQGKLPD